MQNVIIQSNLQNAQLVGFEPTLPEGIWFRVRRLNHSATTALADQNIIFVRSFNDIKFNKYLFPYRELNPGLPGESRVS